MPPSLITLAWISVALGLLSAAIILLDILAGHRQHMAIMNVVWPVTGLWAGPLALAGYYRFGRLSTHHAMMQAKQHHEETPAKKKPFWAVSALAATHCGSGCTLGDLLAEWGVFFLPVLLTWFGYRSLFEQRMFATWILDFILAFLLGIVFQYFTIVPMRHLPPLKGIWQAIKADTLSLTAWQVGMYGWMAVAVFLIFHHELRKTSPVFWFMMQIAMLVGFLAAFPVNWWLVRSGVKEKM
ncbi:MAG TPA: DUF4396 domain-containing protein [Phycisphaerae bacterium]|nr:DUF4396 domain-containing protein [Phycisphaerae bacterium]